MNHLFITDNFLPHFGGSRIYYYRIMKELQQSENFFILTRNTDGAGDFDRGESIPITRADFKECSLLRPLRLQELPVYQALFNRAYGLCKRENIDIIHCGEALPCGLVGLALAKLLGIPWALYVHDEPFARLTRLQPHIKKFITRKASFIVASCSFARARLREAGLRDDNIFVINFQYDTKMFFF